MTEVRSTSCDSRQLPLRTWEVRGPFGYRIIMAHASTADVKNRVERGDDGPCPGV